MRVYLVSFIALFSYELNAAQLNYMNSYQMEAVELNTVKAVKYLLKAENNLRTQTYSDAAINLKKSREFAQNAYEVLLL